MAVQRFRVEGTGDHDFRALRLSASGFPNREEAGSLRTKGTQSPDPESKALNPKQQTPNPKP